MMKVTIITACYNRAATVKNAMESVLGQTYPEIEYIVVDGASSDGSTSVIEECLKREERKVKFISEPDHGMYEAINKGIRMATGDVIALCHSDDQLYDAHTVEKVVKVFEQHPEADMVYADGVFVNSNGQAARVWKGGRNRRWKLNCGWLPLHTTFFIRKGVFEQYGLYDESYRIAADTKLLLELLYKERLKTAYLNKYVVRMLMGGASTDKEMVRKMWKEDIRVFKEMGFHFPVVMKMMKMMWKPAQFVRAKWS